MVQTKHLQLCYILVEFMNKAFTLIETLLILFILTIMMNLLINFISLDYQIENNYYSEGEELQ